MNVFDALDQGSRHFPGKEAIVFGSDKKSYRELYQDVCRLSSALQRVGQLGVGVRIALFLPNRPEFVVAYYAVVRLGAIAVSLNVMLKREEVRFILNDCEAKVLITTNDLLDQVPNPSEIPSVKKIICTNQTDRAGIIEWSQLVATSSIRTPTANLPPHAGAAILYTSGTTGKPKGVLLSQGNLSSNVAATIHHTRMSASDRLICYLPLFHCFGQNFIMNSSVKSGATLVLHERFNPDDILNSLKQDQVSMFFGVPAVYARLLTIPGVEEYFRSVRYCFTAAAPMTVAIAKKWREKVGKTIYEGYGLTETSPFACYNHDSLYRDGSVGTPITEVQVKVMDLQGDPLPPGEIGEIAIKGPCVMQGYFRRPRETAEAIRNGWFLTGDIGKIDEQGYIYLVDRAKDMINTSGFKVWPSEVEAVLMQHPSIAEVAVVGVPDSIAGETVKAFGVLKAGESIQEQELIEFCRARMAVYKAPRAVEFIAALPKNPTGKILKRELRAKEQQNHQTASDPA